MKKFLETKRLIIQFPSLAEIEKSYALDADPEVMRYIGNGKPRDQEESKSWYEKAIKLFDKHGFSFGMVYEKETGDFVGRAGLNYKACDDAQPDIEVGYRLHKKFWHKGYATELATALLNHAFQHLNLEKICAFTHPDNTGSQRVLEKAGMRLVGKDNYTGEEVLRYEVSKKEYLSE